jgi:predicted DNA binding protein
MEEKKKKPVIVELELTHNCFCTDVPEKMKDGKIKYLAYTGSTPHTVYHLFEVRSPELDKILEKIRKHPTVRQVQILRKSDNLAEIHVESDKDPSTAEALLKSKSIFIQPAVYEGGVEKLVLMAPSDENFRDFIKHLDESFDVKLKSKHYLKEKEKMSLDLFKSTGFIKLREAADLITDKQMEVFDLACKNGYYDEPKKISIRELAEMMDISEAAFSELLRKAERKLLPVLSNIMKVVR